MKSACVFYVDSLKCIYFLLSFQCFWCMDGCALGVRQATVKSHSPRGDSLVQYVGSKIFALEASLVLFKSRSITECESLVSDS